MGRGTAPARAGPDGVVVLGMHRSGTSAVTRCLALLGLYLAEGPLVPASADNPEGFWESADLVSANDQILHYLGGSWSAPPPVEDGWAARPDLDEARGDLAGLFDALHPRPGWVWKDPRTCLTLPLWLTSWTARPAAAIVLRRPAAVAASLTRRNGFSAPYGLALWERYVRAAVDAVVAAALPTTVVWYEDLLADPAAVVGALDGWLAAAGVARANHPDAAAAAASVRPDATRAPPHDPAAGRTGDGALDELLSGPQRALLDGLHRTGPEGLAATLPPETPTTEALFVERRVVLGLRDELAAALGDLGATVAQPPQSVHRLADAAHRLSRI